MKRNRFFAAMIIVALSFSALIIGVILYGTLIGKRRITMIAVMTIMKTITIMLIMTRMLLSTTI